MSVLFFRRRKIFSWIILVSVLCLLGLSQEAWAKDPLWKKLTRQSYKLHEEGKSDEAFHAAKEAVRLAKINRGPLDQDVADAFHALALQHQVRGELTQAALFNERALEINKALYGWNDPRVSESLYRIANLYHEMDLFDEAETLYQQALEIAEIHYGPKSIKLLDILQALAVLYKDYGFHERAFGFFDEVFTIMDKSKTTDVKRRVVCLNHVADLHLYLENFVLAGKAYQTLVRLLENHPNEDPLALASAYNNLGSIYKRQRQYAEAQTAYRQALRILLAHYGPDRREVKTVMMNLDLVYQRMEEGG